MLERRDVADAGPLGKALEDRRDMSREAQREVRKDARMWVYDGESWTDDDSESGQDGRGGNRPAQSQQDHPSRFEDFHPELQVIEITPLTPRIGRLPHSPAP